MLRRWILTGDIYDFLEAKLRRSTRFVIRGSTRNASIGWSAVLHLTPVSSRSCAVRRSIRRHWRNGRANVFSVYVFRARGVLCHRGVTRSAHAVGQPRAAESARSASVHLRSESTSVPNFMNKRGGTIYPQIAQMNADGGRFCLGHITITNSGSRHECNVKPQLANCTYGTYHADSSRPACLSNVPSRLYSKNFSRVIRSSLSLDRGSPGRPRSAARSFLSFRISISSGPTSVKRRRSILAVSLPGRAMGRSSTKSSVFPNCSPGCRLMSMSAVGTGCSF